MLAGIILTTIVRPGFDGLHVRSADRYLLVAYRGMVGAHEYELTLGVSELRKARKVQLGDQAKSTRTKVDGRPAWGVFPIWSRPKTELSTFKLRIDGKDVLIPPRAHTDVFNVRLEEMFGTSPPNGNLAVTVSPRSYELEIHIRPLPTTSHDLQSTNAEFVWRIRPDGNFHRSIYETERFGNRPASHSIGPTIDWGLEGEGLLRTNLKLRPWKD